MKRQWYYRGSLKSCNYSCSYCPFSKRKGSRREWQEDEAALLRFVEECEHQKITGAVQFVPYGEALIHPYYWKALARLSRNPGIDAVGAQSNFSFPAEEMMYYFLREGGCTKKLRLWGTFHPQMTTVQQFASQCEVLSSYAVPIISRNL